MTISVAPDFKDWFKAGLERAEAALDARLPARSVAPARLHEAMRYAALDGGKRIRPMLVYATGELSADRSASVRDSLDSAACAVELIHAYSLVHDDLPCMDNDDLRRGKPTVHRQFDEATAMLVGDALQAQAFQALVGLPAESLAAGLAELSRAAGSVGMAGGQAIDLAAVGNTMTQESLEDMHRRKTGALLTAAVRLGWFAACPGQQMPASLETYAAAVGLAFQVVDDILDVEGDTADLGKTAGKDAEQNKPTFVSILGLAKARSLANSLQTEATEALAEFGPDAGRLASIADLVTNRKH
ncbi:MAG: polyprenyl synthetase family protein [Burkholderiaceae bacterium]